MIITVYTTPSFAYMLMNAICTENARRLAAKSDAVASKPSAICVIILLPSCRLRYLYYYLSYLTLSHEKKMSLAHSLTNTRHVCQAETSKMIMLTFTLYIETEATLIVFHFLIAFIPRVHTSRHRQMSAYRYGANIPQTARQRPPPCSLSHFSQCQRISAGNEVNGKQHGILMTCNM